MVMSLRWTALSASVRGASHEKSGQGNQDAVRLKNPSGTDDVLLLAVADGHGSTRSFRSDRGSALAAECALARTAPFRPAARPGRPAEPRAQPGAERAGPRTWSRPGKAPCAPTWLPDPFTLLEFAAFPEPPPVLKPGEELPDQRLSRLRRDAGRGRDHAAATSSIRSWATATS